MLLAESLQILARAQRVLSSRTASSVRTVRSDSLVAYERRWAIDPRQRGTHHEADHRTQNCDHVYPFVSHFSP